MLTGAFMLLVAACGAPAGVRSVGPAPNILVVSIDTLRADRVGRADARGAPLMPNLSVFAASAAQFTRAYSQANETLYSHAALFTGRYPSQLGPIDYARFTIAGVPTLATTLRAAGYRTEGIVAGGHLAPEFGLHAGFHRYASGRDFGSFQQTVPLALARLDVLAASDSPWLLFVHGYDVHAPYVNWGPVFGAETPAYAGPLRAASLIPWTFEQILGGAWYPGFGASFVGRGDRTLLDPRVFDALERYADEHPEDGQPLAPADVAFVRGMYDTSARYADYQVGVLLEGLGARGLSEDTVVVVLSDHGEDLLEHGHVNHRLSLHDENLHVPLMIRGPGVAPGVSEELVALTDVLPTLAALAGVPSPPGEGRSLFAPAPDRAVYSEAARGEVSVRTAAGRLSVPAEVARAPNLPAEAPSRAFVTGPSGETSTWTDPLAVQLHRRLREVAP